jgi:hypothetical protein
LALVVLAAQVTHQYADRMDLTQYFQLSLQPLAVVVVQTNNLVGQDHQVDLVVETPLVLEAVRLELLTKDTKAAHLQRAAVAVQDLLVERRQVVILVMVVQEFLQVFQVHQSLELAVVVQETTT